MPETPRDRILSTALRLFNQQGALTTGIDQIIAESGVAKRTFYRYFPSKVDLLAAYFRQRNEIWHARLTRYVTANHASPLDRLLSTFDALQEWYGDPDFFGCVFMRGLSDFGPDSGAPLLRQCIQEHFDQLERFLTEQLREVRPNDYAAFVPQLMSLIAGSTIVAHATHNPSIAAINKEMARKLLTDDVLHTR
ncbi:MAG: TetR/AcrR family transcriptional regulator [Candidatus Methylacidiphilales bacterium]|nr:TetR/AcrR family transcriptional regulator [Candidatus Methylacidiphilales bacterium]